MTANNYTGGSTYQSGLWEKIVVMVAACAFLLLVVFLIVRNQPFADENLVIITRVVLSLSVAALGATIPGFIHVGFDRFGFVIRAGGALALFVLTFFGSPKVLPIRTTKQPPERRSALLTFEDRGLDGSRQRLPYSPRYTPAISFGTGEERPLIDKGAGQWSVTLYADEDARHAIIHLNDQEAVFAFEPRDGQQEPVRSRASELSTEKPTPITIVPVALQEIKTVTEDLMDSTYRRHNNIASTNREHTEIERLRVRLRRLIAVVDGGTLPPRKEYHFLVATARLALNQELKPEEARKRATQHAALRDEDLKKRDLTRPLHSSIDYMSFGDSVLGDIALQPADSEAWEQALKDMGQWYLIADRDHQEFREILEAQSQGGSLNEILDVAAPYARPSVTAAVRSRLTLEPYMRLNAALAKRNVDMAVKYWKEFSTNSRKVVDVEGLSTDDDVALRWESEENGAIVRRWIYAVWPSLAKDGTGPNPSGEHVFRSVADDELTEKSAAARGDDDLKVPFKHCVRLKTVNHSISFTTPLNLAVSKHRFLRWYWRPEKFPEGGDARYPVKDNAACQVVVFFGRDESDIPEVVYFMWNTEEAPIGKPISALSVFPEFLRKQLSPIRFTNFVLKAGSNGQDIWHSVEIDLVDYLRCIDEKQYADDQKLPRIYGVSVLSNSQHTKGESQASFGPLVFSKTQSGTLVKPDCK